MKNLFLLILFLIIVQLSPSKIFAQSKSIVDFEVKENLSQNGKLAIIALDTTMKTDNGISGNYKFTINGFQQDLQFTDGVAVTANPIESSTFVFFKHKSQWKNIDKLYFLRLTDKGITPYKISGMLMILIPLVILFIAYKLKRFLITLAIIAVVYFYLNYSKGLDVKEILESFITGIRELI